MSFLYKTDKSSLLDHRNYTANLYKNVIVDKTVTSSALLSELFSILSPENKAVNRKRNHEESKHEEVHLNVVYSFVFTDGCSCSSHNLHLTTFHKTLRVKEEFRRFLMGLDCSIGEKLKKKYNISNTQTVRHLAQKLNESTVFDHIGMNGGNNSDVPLRCKIKDYYFLIPEKSRFFCGCIKEQCLKLRGNKYDILIADPPWWNKYIRRLKGANDKLSYSMMYNEDIASIPVRDLLSPNCLVAVWCTNATSNITAVKDLIFPSWGVQYVTTWYWLKVTVDMQPICAFSGGCKKQPFERIILGKVGQVKDFPDSHLIVSIPSALHSHKPPLLEILSQYLNTDRPQVLELFARYLLPNTTSVGYEPLKWQHISLYEDVT